MDYNLTEKQQKLLQWLVQQVKDKRLEESFSISQLNGEQGVIGSGGVSKERLLSELNPGQVEALRLAGLLTVSTREAKTGHLVVHYRDFALTGQAYKAVDTNFSNPSESAPASKLADTAAPAAVNPRAIFVVHGHDQENLARLMSLLRERYKLEPIVLRERPGKGQTIIEKFESEATVAAFAFVLVTPDDVIKKPDSQYSQARQNVVFELGWFYGRLGRARVCIISKKGTTIQSDLAGISLIEFKDLVDEKTAEIDRELISGGMVTAEEIKSINEPIDSKKLLEKAKKFF